MKKSLVVVVAVVILAIIAGIFFFTKNGEAPATKEEKSATEKVMEDAKDSVIGSLKDAIGLGKKMECVYKDGNFESKTYIDGMKYKSITTSSEGEMISVFDGSDFYGWNTKTKEGYVMKKTCMEELSKNVPKVEGGENSNPADFETTEDIVEDTPMDNCKETGAIDFTIPKDISFVDQCEMLKNLSNSLKDFKIPTGQ